jgi:hypothetical protein
MTTLTDRYVAEVARRLPERSRDDIGREIRATIADMVDSRGGEGGGDGGGTEEVERAVIVELGDPAVLARRYADQPQHLVGPEIYPAFMRLMTWVVPLVAVVSIASSSMTYATTDDAPTLGEMAGTIIGQLVVAMVMTVGIGTIIAALLERLVPVDDRHELLGAVPHATWSVDDLWRDPPTRRVARGESVAALVLLTLMAVVPFLPASFFYVPDVPAGEGLLAEDLWSSWVPAYFVVLALVAAVELARLVRGTATSALIWSGVAADVLLGAFLTVLLVTQDVLNPALPDARGLESVPVVPIVLACLWAGIVWNQVTTIRAFRLARR